ncbi:MAG: type II toxin-antitoxin system HicB family antitoxin [Candidatus Nitrosocosmicus sp.]
MPNSNISSLRHEYTIIYSKDEEGYSGRCIELPAAISQGKTLDELKENMREAIELVIESTREEAEKQRNSNKMTIEISI